MKHTRNEQILLWIMALSTLPFLLILTKLDFSLLQTAPEIFYANALIIIANLCGLLGALLFFWQILMGTRLFTSHLTPNTIWTNTLHRKLGTYGIIFVLVHPLLEAYNYLKSVTWLFEFSFHTEADTHISFGRMALILFLIIWMTSAVLRGKMKFRPWKYIHYLTYPLMAFVFIHALDIGTFISTLPWVQAYWNILLIAYIAIVITRLLIGIGGIGKKNYKLIHIEHIGESIVILHLSPVSKRIKPPAIGQYAYLQHHALWQAHPFTVMDYDEKTGELVFGIRVTGSFTQTLNHLSEGSELRVDGPYGVFTREAHNSDEKIIIAGGIGITPFVRLAKTYGKGTTLIYCNRSEADAISRETLRSSVDRYVDIIEQTNRPEEEHTMLGRIDINKVKKILSHIPISNPPFFICGSPVFIKIIKNMLINGGVPKEHIHAEELGFL